MAKIRALSSVMPKGSVHDSVRDRKRNGSVNGIPFRHRRRQDIDLRIRCNQAWNDLEDVRQVRDRIRRYTYEDQWGDIIEYRRGTITERKYIQSKGNIFI